MGFLFGAYKILKIFTFQFEMLQVHKIPSFTFQTQLKITIISESQLKLKKVFMSNLNLYNLLEKIL